jgi:hypothetical protein
MKLHILTILSVLTLVIYSCKSKKAGGTATTEDLYTPGEAQLQKIQTVYPDATAQTLKEGHAIYIGACTNCHGKKNMYKRTAEEWEKDVNRMAPKAKITDAQKDALWKYVIAMRMTHTTFN